MLYRVAVNEKKESKYLVYENITDSQMLYYYDLYKNAFCLKIYQLDNDSFWKIESVFENGKLVQFMDVVKESKHNVNANEPFSITKLFDSIGKAAPFRSESPISFMKEIISGEDITKPKLTIIKYKDINKSNE